MGTSYVVNFIIVFFVIFIALFVGTLSYTKAFKVKNKIVDTIEKHNGEIESSSNKLDSDVQKEIDEKLGQIGYRISDKTTCELKGRFRDGAGGYEMLSKSGSSSYRYCIYKFSDTKGDYYGVVAYIYFEVPIIGSKLEFPVYGETKTFLKLQ